MRHAAVCMQLSHPQSIFARCTLLPYLPVGNVPITFVLEQLFDEPPALGLGASNYITTFKTAVLID